MAGSSGRDRMASNRKASSLGGSSGGAGGDAKGGGSKGSQGPMTASTASGSGGIASIGSTASPGAAVQDSRSASDSGTAAHANRMGQAAGEAGIAGLGSNGGIHHSVRTEASSAPLPVKTGGIVLAGASETSPGYARTKFLLSEARSARLADGTLSPSAQAVRDAEASGQTITINIDMGARGNSANPDSSADARTPGVGSSASITFNPFLAGQDMGGGVGRDPGSSLVHEIAHSFEMTRGTFPSGTDWRKTTEVAATSMENWHRKAMGLPQRPVYQDPNGGPDWQVPRH